MKDNTLHSQNGSSSFVTRPSQASLQASLQQQFEPSKPGRDSRALEAPRQVRWRLHPNALLAGPQDARALQPPPLRPAPPAHPADPPAHSAGPAPRPDDPPACPAGPRARPSRAACSGSRPQRHLALGRRRASSCQPKTGTSGADTAPPSRGRRRGGAARPRDFIALGHEQRVPALCCRSHSTEAGVATLLPDLH